MAENLKYEIREFKTRDGIKFPLYSWRAVSRQRDESETPDMIILHGMGSAPSEMAPLAEVAQEAGFNVLSYAMRNQGLDPRKEKHGKAFKLEEIFDDFREFLSQEFPGDKKFFLAGESMGGIFALSLMSDLKIRERVSGMILLSPVIRLRRTLPVWQKVVAELIYKIAPNLIISPALFVHGRSEPPQLTSDGIYESKGENRPHNVSAYALGFTVQVNLLMELAQKTVPEISCPLLLLGGKYDPFIGEEQLRDEFEKFASADKQIKIFEDTYHLIFFDRDAEMAKSLVFEWMRAH
ncbi:MAG: alpha/beta fold hydrolase [Chthoniobacterales bacterium]